MKPPRDPEKDKARDLARQRKIANNGSDKAARRNVPLRKAMANRKIRRTDKAELHSAAIADPEAEAITPTLADQHGRKWKSWGSDNAAEHRARAAEAQAVFRESGGRRAVHEAQRKAFLATIDNEASLARLNALLQQLQPKK